MERMIQVKDVIANLRKLILFMDGMKPSEYYFAYSPNTYKHRRILRDHIVNNPPNRILTNISLSLDECVSNAIIFKWDMAALCHITDCYGDKIELMSVIKNRKEIFGLVNHTGFNQLLLNEYHYHRYLDSGLVVEDTWGKCCLNVHV